MIVEGEGIRAPAPVRERLAVYEQQFALQRAIEIAEFRGWKTAQTQWKRGLIAEPIRLPYIGPVPGEAGPTFIGLIGELAVLSYLSRRCNLCLALNSQLMLGGDGGTDLEIGPLTLQIKSRQSISKPAAERVSLVRYATARGRVVWPTCNVLVFCETMLPLPTVKLLGWLYTFRARDNELLEARIGDHLNKEIADRQLEPMQSLAERITAREELA